MYAGRKKWMFASISTSLCLCGAAASAQEIAPPAYAEAAYFAPPGAGGEPASLDSIMARLEQLEREREVMFAEADARLDKIEGAAKKKKEDDEKKKKEDAKKEKKWYDKYSIRGYSQLRYNYFTHDNDPSASPHYVGDGSIGSDQEFILRRARIIISGNVSDHAYIYIQPDFASTPDGSAAVNGNIMFGQLRDWYTDLYVDKTKIHRFRVGQSKVPYGFENLQSSQNRLSLDRNDAFNSGVRNERDLGVFYYYTPEREQELFKKLVDDNLKGSGNYGVFGFGFYNGQGGSIREMNDQLHTVAHFALPWENQNGQIWEIGAHGYIGKYVSATGAYLGRNAAGTIVSRTPAVPDTLDSRLGWTLVKYPQPFGFQAEWTVGRGPALNTTTAVIEERALYGGYVLGNMKIDTACHGVLFPFAKYSQFTGGYKNQTNSPYSQIHECSLGLEWQFRKEVELVCEYLITDRTNTSNSAAATLDGVNYQQFNGEVLRFQLQVNY